MKILIPTCYTFIYLYHTNFVAALLIQESKSWSIKGVGVTSLTKPRITTRIGDDSQWSGNKERVIYVGTKRGNLKKLSWMDGEFLETISEVELHMTINQRDDGNTSGNDKNAEVDNKDFVLKPYPIFSIDHMNVMKIESGDDDSHPHEMIAFGGADRFVTILQTKSAAGNEWQVIHRLGPHTGWVKALVQSTSKKLGTNLLFSIGCNCIEVWKLERDMDAIVCHHWKKLEIESSVTMGCTLSSDLLCLGILRDDYLFAAGVDGRIHRWEICETFHKYDAVSAHNGRANSILVCDILNVLVTAGNDGYLLCKEISDLNLQDWITISLDISENVGNNIKVMSLCLIHEDNTGAVVALGTSSGSVILSKICRNLDDFSIVLLGECNLDAGKDCIVFSIQLVGKVHLQNGTKYTLAVGHQSGLDMWEFVLKSVPFI